jgi:hypothetical protein
MAPSSKSPFVSAQIPAARRRAGALRRDRAIQRARCRHARILQNRTATSAAAVETATDSGRLADVLGVIDAKRIVVPLLNCAADGRCCHPGIRDREHCPRRRARMSTPG